ncbi:type IV pilus assembly protein PilM [Lacisediminihabitans changchengi]|uniref:Type IV pilus assembly protein PilM n=1 Tax=Lacisediminihabitans changchengi TaxID=2787634 RepID=A0A934SN31_9MICO|nr:type IV pilus assembly protein PilM [Lacisediminihabitans changchengi]MBK4348415.1 type IV pilus assembly protein PilM [Lacisediminihabitans changchengi]
MGKTIVGLDISANAIRAAELTTNVKGKQTLVRYHSVPLPEGAVLRGEVMEPSTVATALRQLWSTGGFSSKDVVLGIGNSRVLARDLTVPKAPLARIRESLPFHVQELLPFPTENALLDFYPISEGTDANGPVVHGLLVAALKDAVLGNVRAAQLAGLNPVDVDLVPFALTRVLSSAGDMGTAAMIDVGANTTIVVVSSAGVPQFVRIIPTGGDDLTAALSTKLNLTLDAAEAIKRTLGLAATPTTADEQAAIVAMYEHAGELISSLRNTLTYYAGTRAADDAIGRVILSGGGAQLSGFSNALSEYTRLPVTIGDPLASVTVGRFAEKTVSDGFRGSSVAIGLALGSAA